MNKQVSVLAVIAILALGLGVWLIQSPSKDKFEASLLFDDLQKFANQVKSVEISNAQGVLFKAQKSGNSWLANFDPEQPAYPISQDKLADFVEIMMRLKLVEAKTSKSKNYARLGLQSIDIDDSMASLVIMKTNKQSWQVLVGNKVTLGEGHYILKPDDAQSWRTDKTINLPLDKFSWLKRPILPYQVQDIISISRVDSLDWHITKSANSDFYLINMPKDRELEYPSILNSIVSNLISLDFERLIRIDEDAVDEDAVDEAAVDEEFTQSLKVLTQLEVNTAEQKIFQMVVSELDDKYYVNFTSEGLQDYWQKWYYQISSFSANQLIKTLDDFLVEEITTTIPSNNSTQTVDEGDSPN
jgi:hypothetical protein